MENFIKLVDVRRDEILEINDHLSTEVDSIIDQLKKFAAANQLVFFIYYLIYVLNYYKSHVNDIVQMYFTSSYFERFPWCEETCHSKCSRWNQWENSNYWRHHVSKYNYPLWSAGIFCFHHAVGWVFIDIILCLYENTKYFQISFFVPSSILKSVINFSTNTLVSEPNCTTMLKKWEKGKTNYQDWLMKSTGLSTRLIILGSTKSSNGLKNAGKLYFSCILWFNGH